jgi:hypothetical protein
MTEIADNHLGLISAPEKTVFLTVNNDQKKPTRERDCWNWRGGV